MLTFPSALKIYLAVEPVDMRKAFNGLWTIAEQKLREDPRQGAVFVFVPLCSTDDYRPQEDACALSPARTRENLSRSAQQRVDRLAGKPTRRATCANARVEIAFIQCTLPACP